MKFKGIHKAEYEVTTPGFDLKVTKPDGKVFFIPIKDMERYFFIVGASARKQSSMEEMDKLTKEYLINL